MSRTIRLDRALLGLALVLLGAGLLVAVAPGGANALPGVFRSLDRPLPQSTVEVLVTFVLLGYVCWRLVRGRSTGAEPLSPAELGRPGSAESDVADGARQGDAGTSSPRTPDPEPFATGSGRPAPDDATPEARIAGAELARELQTRREHLRSASGAPRPEPVDALRKTAVALQHVQGCDVEGARERVDRGEWTDDPVAAAFLGGPGAGRIPLRRRVLSVLYPARAFDRRLERTLDALERGVSSLGSGGGPGAAPPKSGLESGGGSTGTASGTNRSDVSGADGRESTRTGDRAPIQRPTGASDGPDGRDGEDAGDRDGEDPDGRGGKDRDGCDGEAPNGSDGGV